MCSICLGHSYNLKNKPMNQNNNNRLKDNSWTMVYHGNLTTKITQIKITENGKVEKRHECWWISWIRIDVARCTDTSLFHHDKLFRKGPCLNRRNIWKKRKKNLLLKSTGHHFQPTTHLFLATKAFIRPTFLLPKIMANIQSFPLFWNFIWK